MLINRLENHNQSSFTWESCCTFGLDKQRHMEICYLLLGSNTGDRLAYLEKAAQAVSKIAGPVSLYSSVYETEPWGFDDNIAFLNQVIEIRTTMQAAELMRKILIAETILGRLRSPDSTGYISRTIDIDLLFYGQHIIARPGLTIPHPRLHQRRFTLVPLAEIAPGLFHPVLKSTIAQLERICPDKLRVIKYGSNS